MNEPDWEKLVPEVTLRPQQREGLHRVWTELYENDKDICVLEAPTGTGKSIIELALCRYQVQLGGNSYITTPQRVLQREFKTWNGVKIMMGKGSYDCNVVHGATAATAPCGKSGSFREQHPIDCSDAKCPYFYALRSAQESSIVVHNYASLMAQAHIGRHFGSRSLICLDEGHTAVHWIRNYMSCDFMPSDLQALTNTEPPKDLQWFAGWLRWTLMDVDEIPRDLPDPIQITLRKLFAHRWAFGLLTREDLEAKWIETDQDKPFNEFAKRHLKDSGAVPWTTLWNEPNKWHRRGWWSMIPLKVAPMVGSLTNLGAKVLIVTATALNKALFCVELGITNKNPAFVVMDSAFDSGSRPVVRDYVGSMSFKHRRQTMPRMLDKLAEIANKHRSEPGIIHTVSHKLSWDLGTGLRERLGGRPVEILPRGPDRDFVIDRFLSGALGPSAILIGPSMMEGVDGKGDSCRWQVLTKAPWMHMGDPVVRFLLDSPNANTRRWARAWYTWKAAQQAVQGIGRVCRSRSDYGVTYILDSSYKKIIESGYVPQYVLDAVN